jgi:glycerol kinase
MQDLILSLDQGTTSTRAIVFDAGLRAIASAQIPLAQHYPHPGWVEHDLEEIWRAALEVCRQAIEAVGGPRRIAAIGITNQRETTAIWDRRSGTPLHRAIVWQDRRTGAQCDGLRAQESWVQSQSGLLLDPYFSATKMAWLLDHIPGARQRAEQGEIALGTIDAFLIWHLTGGRVLATDPSNASRTSLLSLESLDWSPDLGKLFGIPLAALPSLVPSAGLLGETDPGLFGAALPIAGIAGDQQAALIGHACFRAGEAKATFGTGCFLLAHTGDRPRPSRQRLLTSVGYRQPSTRAYVMEGSIFSSGASMQWLRDGLGLLGNVQESEAIAAALPDNGGVYLVPAFTGLGAPQWEANARGGVFGLTRDTRAAHLVRAGLEACAFQAHDLIQSFAADGAAIAEPLRVDGGLSGNSWAMQFLADILDMEIERPAFQEMTALGAARLAMVGAGLAPRLEDTPDNGLAPRRFEPKLAQSARVALLAGWQAAVAGVLSHARP